MAKDLLHPTPEEEKKKHKLKRLVQSPNSFFMDVKCPGKPHPQLFCVKGHECVYIGPTELTSLNSRLHFQENLETRLGIGFNMSLVPLYVLASFEVPIIWDVVFNSYHLQQNLNF